MISFCHFFNFLILYFYDANLIIISRNSSINNQMPFFVQIPSVIIIIFYFCVFVFLCFCFCFYFFFYLFFFFYANACSMFILRLFPELRSDYYLLKWFFSLVYKARVHA
jgi:hypothetical protein